MCRICDYHLLSAWPLTIILSHAHVPQTIMSCSAYPLSARLRISLLDRMLQSLVPQFKLSVASNRLHDLSVPHQMINKCHCCRYQGLCAKALFSVADHERISVTVNECSFTVHHCAATYACEGKHCAIRCYIMSYCSMSSCASSEL